MSATVIVFTSPSPITVVSRIDQDLHHGRFDHISLQEEGGRIHYFLRRWRDVKVLSGRLDDLPLISLEEAKARSKAHRDAAKVSVA